MLQIVTIDKIKQYKNICYNIKKYKKENYEGDLYKLKR